MSDRIFYVASWDEKFVSNVKMIASSGSFGCIFTGDIAGETVLIKVLFPVREKKDSEVKEASAQLYSDIKRGMIVGKALQKYTQRQELFATAQKIYISHTLPAPILDWIEQENGVCKENMDITTHAKFPMFLQVQDLAPGMTLTKYASEVLPQMSNETKRDIIRALMFQLVYGAADAQSGFAFGNHDIKLDNTMVEPWEDGGELVFYVDQDVHKIEVPAGGVKAKYIDFDGSAILIRKQEGSKKKKTIIPAVVSSPSIISTKPIAPDVDNVNGRNVDEDNWLLGRLMLNVLARAFPEKLELELSALGDVLETPFKEINFGKKDWKDNVQTTLDGIFEKFPADLELEKLFLKRLLAVERVDRLSFGLEGSEFSLANALYHPYFSVHYFKYKDPNAEDTPIRQPMNKRDDETQVGIAKEIKIFANDYITKIDDAIEKAIAAYSGAPEQAAPTVGVPEDVQEAVTELKMLLKRFNVNGFAIVKEGAMLPPFRDSDRFETVMNYIKTNVDKTLFASGTYSLYHGSYGWASNITSSWKKGKEPETDGPGTRTADDLVLPATLELSKGFFSTSIAKSTPNADRLAKVLAILILAVNTTTKKLTDNAVATALAQIKKESDPAKLLKIASLEDTGEEEQEEEEGVRQEEGREEQRKQQEEEAEAEEAARRERERQALEQAEAAQRKQQEEEAERRREEAEAAEEEQRRRQEAEAERRRAEEAEQRRQNVERMRQEEKEAAPESEYLFKAGNELIALFDDITKGEESKNMLLNTWNNLNQNNRITDEIDLSPVGDATYTQDRALFLMIFYIIKKIGPVQGGFYDNDAAFEAKFDQMKNLQTLAFDKKSTKKKRRKIYEPAYAEFGGATEMDRLFDVFKEHGGTGEIVEKPEQPAAEEKREEEEEEEIVAATDDLEDKTKAQLVEIATAEGVPTKKLKKNDTEFAASVVNKPVLIQRIRNKRNGIVDKAQELFDRTQVPSGMEEESPANQMASADFKATLLKHIINFRNFAKDKANDYNLTDNDIAQFLNVMADVSEYVTQQASADLYEKLISAIPPPKEKFTATGAVGWSFQEKEGRFVPIVYLRIFETSENSYNRIADRLNEKEYVISKGYYAIYRQMHRMSTYRGDPMQPRQTGAISFIVRHVRFMYDIFRIMENKDPLPDTKDLSLIEWDKKGEYMNKIEIQSGPIIEEVYALIPVSLQSCLERIEKNENYCVDKKFDWPSIQRDFIFPIADIASKYIDSLQHDAKIRQTFLSMKIFNNTTDVSDDFALQTRYLHTLSHLASFVETLDKTGYQDAEAIDRCLAEWPHELEKQFYKN